MKKVNGRYEILREQKIIKGGVRICEGRDLRDGSSVELLLIEKKDEHLCLLRNIEHLYERLRDMDIPYISKVREFDFVYDCEEDRGTGEPRFYLAVFERIEAHLMRQALISAEDEEILEVMISTLQLLNYFHLKGVLWTCFNEGNLYIRIGEDGKKHPFLKDPIRSAIEYDLDQVSKMAESRRSSMDTQGGGFSFRSVGKFFLSLFLRREEIEDPTEALSVWRKELKDGGEARGLRDRISLYLIKKLGLEGRNEKTGDFSFILREIREKFGRNDALIHIDRNQNIRLSERAAVGTLINRRIFEEFMQIRENRRENALLFIYLKKGFLDSCLLSDFRRKISLMDLNVLPVFDWTDSNFTGQWLERFRAFRKHSVLTEEFGGFDKFFREYERLLRSRKVMRVEDLKDKGLMRLLTVAAELLISNTDERMTIIFCRSFNQINEYIRYTMYYAFYFGRLRKLLILAFCEEEQEESEALRGTKYSLIESGRARELFPAILRGKEFEEFLLRTFHGREVSKEFLSFVYQESRGNIHEILEMLRCLLEYGILRFDGERGNAAVEASLESWKKCRLKKNTQEEMSAVFDRLRKDEKELLKWASILRLPKSVLQLADLSRMRKDRVEEATASLISKKLLSVLMYQEEESYRFKEEQFRLFVYERRMSKKERMHKHRRLVGLSEPRGEEEWIALAEHYRLLGDKDSMHRASTFLRILGEQYADRMDYERALEFYESALEGLTDREESFSLLILLFRYACYLKRSEKIESLMQELDRLAESVKDREMAAEFYGRAFINIHIGYIGDAEKASYYREILEQMHEKREAVTAGICLYAEKAREAIGRGDHEIAKGCCRTAIELCGENRRLDDIKGEIFRIWALACLFSGEKEDSVTLNRKAAFYSERGKDVRGKIVALHNMTHVYAEDDTNAENMKKIKEIYENNLSSARKHKIAGMEIFSLYSLSLFYEKTGDAKAAHLYAKQALVCGNETGEQEYRMIVLGRMIYYAVQKGELVKAWSYYEEARRHQVADPRSFNSYAFSETVRLLFFKLRALEKAVEASEPCAQEFFDGWKKNPYQILPFQYFRKLFSEEKESEEELDHLIERLRQMKKTDRILSLRLMYEMCLILHTTRKREEYPLFWRSVVDIPVVDPSLSAIRHLLQSIDEGSISAVQMHEMRACVDSEIVDDAGIQIRLHLAEHYIRNGRIWEAATQFVESIREIFAVMRATPPSFRRKIFETNGYIRPFRYLDHLIDKGDYRGLRASEEISVSADRLNDCLYGWDFMEKVGRLRVADRLKDEKKAFEPDHLRIESVLSEFGDDFEVNLKILLSFLQKMLMAAEVYFCTPEGDKYRPLLFAGNAAEEKWRRWERLIHKKKEEVFTESTEDGILQTLFILPISFEVDLSEGDSPILLFTTSRCIHLFDEEQIRKLRSYLPLLSILTEDYLLKRTSSTDKLTKLFSRAYLENEIIERFVECRGGRCPLSVLMFDLDNFKRINDRYGHLVGDFVLSEVAGAAHSVLPKEVKLGRYGGEEFVAVLHRYTAKEALELAELVRRKVETFVFKGWRDLSVTISLGISELHKTQDTVKGLIERADEALYKAKSEGKNRSLIWSADMQIPKSEEQTVRGILTGNELKDSLYRLSLSEMLRESAKNTEKDEGILNVLTRMIEVFEACEILLVSSCGEKACSLSREEQRLRHFSFVQSDLIEEVRKNPEGFYRVDWEDTTGRNKLTGLIEWNSVMGLAVLSGGKETAFLYMKANLREKEFGERDLKLAEVFSVFLLNYLD
ncbi:MAG: diguanylate cyclase [Peptostreptococcaceae bacterium]|nr:diguanylate cyclase [Peptostreptococcaceae bacterium]